MSINPVILCILDGWGTREKAKDNAISQADTPFWDSLIEKFPSSLLQTSGLSVGLPDGQMGNSEVGHMNIGSGRVVMQNLPRIDASISDNSLEENDKITRLISVLKDVGGSCHLAGLLSDGGVHSHFNHIVKLAKIVASKDIPVKIHAFLDGRDVSPASSKKYIEDFEKDVAGLNVEIVSLSGRYYAMDRDKRWDRVELAYDAIVSADARIITSPVDAIEESYDNEIFDEFIKPCVVKGYKGVQDGDALIMANFRSDRAREILTALLDPDFDGFQRKKVADFSYSVGMVEYSKDLNEFLDTVFEPETLENTLGQVISDGGYKQLRIAETEKYAHVTFFFNGGREEVYKGEDRIMIPSPDVATYDLKPQMSAFELTDELVKSVESNDYELIVVNYANTDMVGHTGVQEAAVKAVETIDKCLEKLVDSANKVGAKLLITADHGNCEQMLNEETGQPNTAHTMNPVPILLVGEGTESYKMKDGSLCDIAPTILELMKINKPKNMTGGSLING